MTDEASTIVEIRNTAQGPPADPSGLTRQTVADNDSVRIDLVSASEGEVPAYRIQDGSVIMVREQDPKTIQVIGLVRKPDQFEIPPGQEVRLLDAIALAGGRTLELADKVHIVRNLDDAENPVVFFQDTWAPNYLLQHNPDIVLNDFAPKDRAKVRFFSHKAAT